MLVATRLRWCGGLVVALLLSSAAAAAAADTPNAALQGLIKAAQDEKTLNIVWGPSLGAAEGARALEAGINKEYGTSIKVNYTPGPAFPQMTARVAQEIKAGRPNTTDVLLGAETTIAAAMEASALAPVNWSEYFPNITPEMRTKNGEAVEIVSVFSGAYYNTHYIKPNEVPKKMADIFNPKWKGKIASTPYAGMFDRLALSLGVDTIRPIVQKTSEWAGGLMRCGEYDRLASGEFILFFFDCGRGDERLSVENGGPMQEAILEDAAVLTTWYLGVPKNSVHPNLAKLFIGFVATPEGQVIIQKYGFTSSRWVAGTAAYKQVRAEEAKGAKIIGQSPDELIQRGKELEGYRAEFQRLLQTK